MLAFSMLRNSLWSTTRRCINTSVVRKDIFDIVDEDDYKKRVLESEIPVIVDFHAGWCAPCKQLAPRLEKVLADFEGKTNLAKVDIDELGDLAIANGVTAVPSIHGIRAGKTVDKFVGLQDTQRILAFVSGVVKG